MATPGYRVGHLGDLLVRQFATFTNSGLLAVGLRFLSMSVEFMKCRALNASTSLQVAKMLNGRWSPQRIIV